jgi:hypothetical protein
MRAQVLGTYRLTLQTLFDRHRSDMDDPSSGISIVDAVGLLVVSGPVSPGCTWGWWGIHGTMPLGVCVTSPRNSYSSMVTAPLVKLGSTCVVCLIQLK